MLAGATGRFEDAARHFDTAMQQARETGAASELAEAAYWYARCLLEHGGAKDRKRARDLLAQAGQLWERLGMPRQLERARSLETMGNGR
jgi:thioredoxin-like negative regulator of GroEL